MCTFRTLMSSFVKRPPEIGKKAQNNWSKIHRAGKNLPDSTFASTNIFFALITREDEEGSCSGWGLELGHVLVVEQDMGVVAVALLVA